MVGVVVDVVVVVVVVVVGCTVEFEGAALRFVAPARSRCFEKSSEELVKGE